MKSFYQEHREAGGATVEIAILSILFFPIIVYATFFFDLSLLNLKVLEASRYAAWELTAIEELAWNWGSGGYSFGSASGIISNEVATRWGDDMNSATCAIEDENNNCFFADQSSGFSVTKLQENGVVTNLSDQPLSFLGNVNVNSSNTSPSESEANGFLSVLQGAFDFLGKTSNWVYKNLFKMNTDGFVLGKVSASLEFDKVAPFPIGSSQALLTSSLFTVEGKEKLLIDAWDLRDGQDVDEGYNHRIDQPTPYYAQVKRMFFFGAVAGVGDLFNNLLNNIGLNSSDLPFTISDILNIFGIHNPFDPVVRSYRLRGINTPQDSGEPYGNCYTSRTACIDYDEGPNGSGKNVADPEKHHKPRRLFYTNVYKDNHDEDESPYYRVYKRQGGYYMGCNKSQQERCNYQ